LVLRKNDEAKPFEMFPGVVRRILNTGDKTMLVELHMAKGSEVPEHTHPHEQIGYLASGRLEFRIGDETKVLEAGDSWLAPGNVPHYVRVLEDAIALDIFSPPREDFLAQP
jgi:quercetin dioxygenase-like cupin family protein